MLRVHLKKSKFGIKQVYLENGIRILLRDYGNVFKFRVCDKVGSFHIFDMQRFNRNKLVGNKSRLSVYKQA